MHKWSSRYYFHSGPSRSVLMDFIYSKYERNTNFVQQQGTFWPLLQLILLETSKELEKHSSPSTDFFSLKLKLKTSYWKIFYHTWIGNFSQIHNRRIHLFDNRIARGWFFDCDLVPVMYFNKIVPHFQFLHIYHLTRN